MVKKKRKKQKEKKKLKKRRRRKKRKKKRRRRRKKRKKKKKKRNRTIASRTSWPDPTSAWCYSCTGAACKPREELKVGDLAVNKIWSDQES